MVNNFEQVRNKLDNIQQQFDKMPTQMASDLTSQLIFTDQMSQIETQIKTILVQIQPQIEYISEQVPGYVDLARTYLRPAFIAPAVLMTLIGLTFFVCFILFIVECCHRKLVSCTGEGPIECKSILSLLTLMNTFLF